MQDKYNAIKAIAYAINIVSDREVIESIKLMPDEKTVTLIYNIKDDESKLIMGDIDDIINYLIEIEKEVIL